jgi:hypothetical protein
MEYDDSENAIRMITFGEPALTGFIYNGNGKLDPGKIYNALYLKFGDLTPSTATLSRIVGALEEADI